MHNDSNRISANEINRYVYCNYQWYYRRLHGDASLTRLKKEYNRALGIKKDARAHAFVKGNKFHLNYHRLYKVKKLIYLIAIAVLSLIIFYTLLRKDLLIWIS